METNYYHLNRKIIHVDMDAFYASVEEKYSPQLKEIPLAIGGTPEKRGVISTANYLARKFGVRSGISSYKALQLCPHLKIIPPDFSKYEKESRAIHQIFARYSDVIEPLSLDEAYIDVTQSTHFNGSATLIATEIRQLIFKELKLTASAGVASNKFLAKIASDWKKPDGLFVLPPEQVNFFLKNLPVSHIFGVGKVTNTRLKELGVITCGDLQKVDLYMLNDIFGTRGQTLFDLSRGVDHRAVQSDQTRKSVSVENTYPHDLPTYLEIKNEIPKLFNEFMNRFEKHSTQFSVKSLFVKLKFFDFKVKTVERSTSLRLTLENFEYLIHYAFYKANKPIRLLGLGVRIEEKNGPSHEQLEFSF